MSSTPERRLAGPTGKALVESTTCFYVQAKADPSVLPRTLNQFAKRGLIPSKWHSVRTGQHYDELHIDIQVAGLDGPLTDLMAACLRQIVDVDLVLTSEKHYAEVGGRL